jgi:hypothetical protein
VADYSYEQIGVGTLVSNHWATLELTLTNDSPGTLSNITVRPALELYVGQEKAQLFSWADPQIIKAIPSKGEAVLNFQMIPFHPGLASIAIYVTDSANIPVQTKRIYGSSYETTPTRWWFHVADYISVEILQELKKLTKQKSMRLKNVQSANNQKTIRNK